VRPDGGIETGDVLLAKYQIESLLGKGGMGLVYRARHLQLHELVAIKVLRADVQLDPEAVTRFKREAQAAVRLKSEHVARIHDVGVFDDGSPYMVMEFLAGADLGSLVDTNGPTDVPTAIDLILQACDALAEAHAAGIVHRDVKPSNLFVSTRPDGTHVLKILDFGISKSATGTDLSLTQTASVLGTPAYMSPEQMRSARRVDARTDIWSLGTVLYELVEGRRPFRAETFSEMCVMAAVDPYDALVLAPELDPVIERCLAKAPEHRYQTIAELAAALAPFARDPNRAAHYVTRAQRMLGRSVIPAPVASPPLPRPPTSAPSLGGEPGTLSGETATRSRSRFGLIGVAVAIAAAAIAGVVIWKAQKQPVEEEEGQRYTMEAIPAPVVIDAGAPIIVVDAAPVIAIDADSIAAGSSSAKKPIRKAGTGVKKAGSAATTVKGSAAPPPPDAGSATKKCNVWESRTGCR